MIKQYQNCINNKIKLNGRQQDKNKKSLGSIKSMMLWVYPRKLVGLLGESQRRGCRLLNNLRIW